MASFASVALCGATSGGAGPCSILVSQWPSSSFVAGRTSDRASTAVFILAGALPPAIDIQLVDAVLKTSLGKAPLIKPLSLLDQLTPAPISLGIPRAPTEARQP